MIGFEIYSNLRTGELVKKEFKSFQKLLLCETLIHLPSTLFKRGCSGNKDQALLYARVSVDGEGARKSLSETDRVEDWDTGIWNSGGE